MTAAEMAVALDEVQAKLAGAHLIAEWFHGIDSRDPDRAMATWHPQGVLGFTPGPVLDGSSAIRAFLEKTRAAYPELYHWVTNLSLSLTVPGDSTMAKLMLSEVQSIARRLAMVAVMSRPRILRVMLSPTFSLMPRARSAAKETSGGPL